MYSLLRHYDMANNSTVVAVQTKDIGYEIGDESEIMEIMECVTVIAGCSIAIEEFNEAK